MAGIVGEMKYKPNDDLCKAITNTTTYDVLEIAEKLKAGGKNE